MLGQQRKNMYPEDKQFDRLEKLIWGLYIFIPFMFLNPWFGL